MILTAKVLAAAVGLTAEAAELWINPINAAGCHANLTTVERWATFLAQTAHESMGFSHLAESLNYSVVGLLATFPTRYSKSLAEKHGRTKTQDADQIAIANHVYNGRMGNRPGTNDGFLYRGSGLPGLTGRTNFIEFGKWCSDDFLEKAAERVRTDFTVAANAAAFFWVKHDLNQYAGDIRACTLKLNGGTNGLKDRIERRNKALLALSA